MKKIIIKIISNEFLWLALILVGAFIVRLYKIDNPLADWHSWRQVDTASVTRTYLDKGLNLLFPQYQDVSSIQTGYANPNGYRFVEFPIYNLIHYALVKNVPQLSLEVAGRLISIFCSLISLIFIFLLGRKYVGKLGGILGAFFFAFLPFSVYYSRVILPEPIGTCFSLGAVWFFTQYIDNEKYGDFYLSAVFLALALLEKPFAIFFTVPLAFLFIQKYGFKKLFDIKFLTHALIYVNIAMLPLLVWRAWMSNYPEGIPFFSWAFNGDHIRFRPAFWRWIFGERLGRLILGIWGLPIFVLGLIWSKRKELFIQFLLLGMFAYVSVIATANVRHDYYQTFIIPAVCLTLAQGGYFLLTNKIINRYISIGIFGFATLMAIGLSFYQIKGYYDINHPELITVGAIVDKITPKDALIIAPYNGDTAFLYQTKRWGWPAIDGSIDDLIKRGADYYVSLNKTDSDTKIIESRFKLISSSDQYVMFDLHQKK